jgi:hypothetical protein
MPVDDYFFLSYARKDEENLEHIGQFFDNLRERVRSQLGNADAPEDYIGFIDREMRPGIKWRLTIAEALATTKTLICVCSQRYFHRP